MQLVICGALLRDPPKVEEEKEISTKEHFSLFMDWKFLLFLLNNFLFNFGSLIVFVLIADFAKVRGLETHSGVYLISTVGISNTIGRALAAVFGACECNRTYLYIVTCILSGIAVTLLTLPMACPQPCYAVMVSCCASYGLFFGMQLANLAIVTNTLAGEQRINAAYGLVMLMNGGGAATGPPLAGTLLSSDVIACCVSSPVNLN